MPSSVQTDMRQRGFTLVEMAIVLVIIGLLTGGVLVGTQLIRSAALRAIPSEYQALVVALNTFRDRYTAIPGDMKNATFVWTALDANAAVCKTMPASGTKTCDGDGNGRITDTGNYLERFRFWQHLSNAELVEGNFSGIIGSTIEWEPGVNIPVSKAGGEVGWGVYDSSQPFPSGQNIYNMQGYTIVFGIPSMDSGSTTNNQMAGPVITPQEAYDIDKKIDDGKPMMGLMQAELLNDCTNGTLATFRTATYNTNTDEVRCALHFPQQNFGYEHYEIIP